MWVLDYEGDVESDLSAFHRVDDPMTLDAARFFSLAVRLAAYAGALNARIQNEDAQRREGTPDAGERRQSAATAPSGPTVVSDAAAIAMLAADGLVEHSTERTDQ
jgi:hypothetical protein